MYWQTHRFKFSTHEAGVLQSRAYRGLSGFMTAALDPYQLTMPTWAMLGAVNDAGEIKLNELANILGIKPPVATELVHQLTARQLLERRPYPDDHRVTLLALTATGNTLVEQIETKLREELRTYLDDIPMADLITYINVLRKLAAKL